MKGKMILSTRKREAAGPQSGTIKLALNGQEGSTTDRQVLAARCGRKNDPYPFKGVVSGPAVLDPSLCQAIDPEIRSRYALVKHKYSVMLDQS